MGKTIRGEKGAGFEFWSRKNYKGQQQPGRDTKKLTLRAERRANRQKKYAA